MNHRVHVLICGLIAGESLMGLFLAIPFVISQDVNMFSLVGDNFAMIGQALSLIVTLAIMYLIYRAGTKHQA
ncbi:MAG: hypothetical protein RLZZ293_1219, partial [Pseudomonadota bacterium]|jgi:hypothetical protein